ncbi:TATA-box-binding protein [Methanococcus maripaludis]|uniref:TATA-box-binding protein n=1 Tax=Methanococcus maripaludis TaxID=39152 RepID=A0A8T4H477_METMI|nr:TATA-box-binding protein [Methanococcus maripaludis]MBM7408416.1 transcription initiation factor TFIID TATA-box-binding protein [Methanococcus maripaludis]MBP2220086.1 transcription initiation factor TFIID TATA-box-binding protein [Methanococcus maripaludis]
MELPEINIVNVVGSCDLKTPMNLEEIYPLIENAEYDPEEYHCIYIRTPGIKRLVTIFKSGKLNTAGSKSIDEAKSAVLEVIDKLNEFGFADKKPEIKIYNIVATISLGKEFDLEELTETFGAEYEPKKFPGAILKTENPKATFLIFKSGKIVINGVKSNNEVENAVKRILEKLMV